MDRQWLQYVGDCGAPATFLAKRSPFSPWLPILGLDALLRSSGQVLLANNPFTGLVYFIGLTVVRPWAGLAAFLCALTCLMTAGISRQPRPSISGGHAVTNAAMLGFVTMVLLYDSPSVRACLLLAGASIVSCYVTSALSSLISALVSSPDKTNAAWPPVFALPYGLLQLLLLVLLPDYQFNHCPTYSFGDAAFNASFSNSSLSNASLSSTASLSSNATTLTAADIPISWGLFLEEIISAPGRVVALHSIIAGASGWAALLVYSPTAAGCALLGSLQAAIVGIALGGPGGSADDVVCAFGEAAANGLLTFMAVGSHSFVPSCGATTAGAAAVALVGAIHAAARPAMVRARLPIRLLPYSCVALLFFLLGHLVRPAKITFPEKQRFDYTGRFGCRTGVDDSEEDDDDEAGRPGSSRSASSTRSKPTPTPTAVRLVTSSL